MLLSVQILLFVVLVLVGYLALRIHAAYQYVRNKIMCVTKLPGRRWSRNLGVLAEIPNPGEDALSFLLGLVQAYPRLSYLFAGSLHVTVAVHHPDTVKTILRTSEPKATQTGVYYLLLPWLGEGLLTSNGKKWSRNRRLLTPAFHFDILKPYIAVNNQAADVLLNKLDKFAKEDEHFEVFSCVSLCALEVVLKCAFSFPEDIQNEDNAYVKAITSLGEAVSYRAIRPWLYLPFLFYMTKKGKEFKRSADLVHASASDVIRRRRETLNEDSSIKSKKMLDFLDILLTARDESGKGLTDQEIRDEVDTFLFEGHDTTASAMSWMLFSMADNPDWQHRCQQEVDEVLQGRDSDDILWDDLQKFPILTACLKETMRLHTTVPLIERELTKDTYLDGYFLPEGTNIMVLLYGLMHSEGVWEDPMKFNPDRFLDENVKRDAYAFLPFSAGPRNCIGQHFAMHEMKVIIARVIRRFTLELDPARPTRHQISVVMKTENGMYVKALPRRTLYSQG